MVLVGGNILAKHTHTMSNGYVSLSPTKTQEYVYETTNPDRLDYYQVKEGQAISYYQAFDYDALGNPTTYNGMPITWQGRKLMSVGDTTMQYDYNGLRTRKGERYYYWLGNTLKMERWGENTIYYYYDESGISGFRYDDKEYYYHKNIFGDVVAIYDKDKDLQATYEYDAWGNHTVTNATDANIGNVNPIRYRSYYWDREFNLYYLLSRYYSPEIGRFISPDSVEYLEPQAIDGLNLYCYCLNNPVMYADPSGHWIATVFDLFSLGASIVEVVINPTSLWSWAGLIGDAVDLLPFVTGVGEGIRATKLVKYADDVIDASYDTIKFVKAADMVDDFSDGGTMLRRVGNLDDYRALTKTTHVDGTKLHKLFMDNGTPILGSRLRVDGLNELTNTVFELKPYNIRNARKGVKQILNYNDALGGGYKMVIVLY